MFIRNVATIDVTKQAEFKSKVVDASGIELFKTQTLGKNAYIPSIPIVVPLTPLPNFPLTVTVDAKLDVGGTLIVSPPELIVDLPIEIGCFNKLAGESSIKQTSPQLCLVHCKTESKRFALINDLGVCSCLGALDHNVLSEINIDRCNHLCSEDESHHRCGGISATSIFVSGKTYKKKLSYNVASFVRLFSYVH